jgi:L-threonylcarbamoyladenylate synthase
MAGKDDTATDVERFAAILRAGGIVAFPTETVYGLGADATNADAVLAIYETKGRPRFNPLIVHCTGCAMAERFARFDPLALRLAEAFWPGPLTLVVPRREPSPIADIVTAGLDSVALRVPAHPIAQALIAAAGRPLAAPSANPSGRLSPTTAAQVREGFGDRVPVLDGGPCEAGVESTIVRVEEGRATQLRPGALSRTDLESVLERPLATDSHGGKIAAPGMMASHYAPRATLRLAAAAPRPGEAYLGFGPEPPGIAEPRRNLSPAGDLREAARNLFSKLHELDAVGFRTIAVAPIPVEGLGEAINDRLRRAAAPRD